jgi:colicin import membrane protein
MRPTEFSTEEIVKAGLELQAAGRNITGFALRQKVGGGSAGRLRQVWAEYANSLSVTQAEPVAELPVEVAEQLGIVSATLIERLKTLAADLNDRAVKASERRVAEVVRAAGSQRSQAERELADASLTVDDLEKNLDAAAADRELLRTKLDESNAAIQKQAVEIAQLKERLEASERATKTAHEQHATDMATWQTTAKGHVAEIAQLRDQLAAANSAAKKAGEQHVAALGEVNAASQAQAVEIAKLRERLGAAEASVSTANEQLKAEATKASQAREEAARYAGQVDVLERQNADLTGKLQLSSNVKQ